MLSPLPRRSGWAYHFARSPSRVSLPRKGCRVGLRIVLFEACSAFTRVTACTLALSPIRDTHIRRLQLFRHLHSCSGCFRLERSPGGICTHWKAPPFHGAHPQRTFNFRPQLRETFRRRWGFRRADDRAAPCSSSPAWSGGSFGNPAVAAPELRQRGGDPPPHQPAGKKSLSEPPQTLNVFKL